MSTQADISTQEVEHKNRVRIHIDERLYESLNPTTGVALYTLANVPEDFELFREIKDAQEDPPIARGPEVVHLHEDEHFHSSHAHTREITIIVNAREKKVQGKDLSYDALVALAFNPVPTGPNVHFTITYENGPHSNPAGTLLEGGKVEIKKGMIFDVVSTDKS